MKILLVQSPTGRAEVPIYPLGLAFLAGQLQGHQVRGLDLSLSVGNEEILEREIREFRPDVTAVSLRNIDDSSYPVTHSYVEPFAGIMSLLEGWNGTVVVGGTGFSIYPGIIMNDFPRIDYGIPGEGEEMLPGLIDHLERGVPIEGWDGGRLLPWRRTDLERIAPPDYGVIDLSRYPVPDSIGVQSRRGCAYACTYCTYGYLGGHEFRTRPVEHVLEDIGQLEGRGVGRFQFVDSVFNAPEDYFLRLLDALEEKGPDISWSAWLDEKVTPDQLRRMKAAGAVKVDFSPDAVTDRGLRMLGKRGRAAELLPVVKAA
ncbi:MAG: cobalamin-dependent protein, partial [Candidatus Fermentibacteraceae bacterium]|nr:cobalamin-dependent protein [Candidatus Fermentibacteraceae bacterium]